MLKQFNNNGKNHLFKKKKKKKLNNRLEIQYQLKEFLKLQRESFPEQPILSIREYQRKKKVIRKPKHNQNRINK